jgi:hypothetical protein
MAQLSNKEIDMKKILAVAVLILALAIPVMAQTADVTIAVTKSLDDPTPRTSVFPASMSPVFKYYLVEQNGALLAQQCLPGCTSLTITGLADGTYSYRVGAVVEVTRSDGSKALTTGWSTAKSVTVLCGTAAVPAAPTLGLTSQVCK